MSVSLSHSGLPGTVRPFDLPDLLAKLRSSLGLRDEDVAYIRYVIAHLRSEDFRPGQICAVWMSAGTLSDALQINLRRLTRIETRLEERGLIARTWRRNGRRFGRRDASGRITCAGGVNLGPLVDRVSNLLDAVRAAEANRLELKEARHRANDLIRAIRALDDADALDAARAVFPRLRPSELGSAERLAEVIDALGAVLDDFASASGRSPETAGSDSSARPCTDREPITRTCTEPLPVRTSPRQVWTLASERMRALVRVYADGLGCDEPDWRCLDHAAHELARSYGLSGRDWSEACDRLGTERAVLCILVADRNRDRPGRWQVRDVAGAFIGLTRQEAMGRALLEELVSEAIRSLGRVGGC